MLALILYAVLAVAEIVFLTRAALTGRIPSVSGASVARDDLPAAFWFMVTIHGLILALFGALTLWLGSKYLGL